MIKTVAKGFARPNIKAEKQMDNKNENVFHPKHKCRGDKVPLVRSKVVVLSASVASMASLASWVSLRQIINYVPILTETN